MPTVYSRGAEIMRAPIDTLPGRDGLVAILYQTDRPSGRRIKVVDTAKPEQPVVFDTSDCYDLANATNALETWLEGQRNEARKAMAARDGIPHGTAHEQFHAAIEADLPDPEHEHGEPVG